jgi:single-strand DNA-binding protein
MNNVSLMGRLTKDPEMRYTPANNTALCKFTLAVDRKFQKQGEEKQADFIGITVWGKTAEFCGNYFAKGMRVALTGKIQTRTWDDNDGKRHYATDVVAEDVYFADTKREGNSHQKNTGNQEPAAELGNEKEDATDGFYPLEDDDDLPF